MEERRSASVRVRDALSEQVSATERRIADEEERLRALLAQERDSRGRLEAAQRDLGRATADAKEAARSAELARERALAAEGARRESEQRLAKARERLAELRGERGKLAVEEERASGALRLLEEQVRAELGLPKDEPLPDPASIALDDEPDEKEKTSTVAALQRLRRRLIALEPVNPLAATELAEIGQRHEFLSTQKADLERAMTDLRTLADDLARTIAEQFSATLQAVDREFGVFFQRLFNGGQASLRTSDDPDEPGIDIYARPPGKRIGSLAQLSGGERALTATALLLAILRVPPAPLCLLDEVDAALDECHHEPDGDDHENPYELEWRGWHGRRVPIGVSIEQGLAKTRGGFFARLFGRGEQPITAEWLDSLEEALLRSDLSVSLVDPLMAQLRDLFTTGELKTIPKALAAVRETLVAALPGDVRLRGNGQKPRVILVVGVNGSGKTTTAAKLAKRLKDSGERPLLAAADTFRAAAIEQLERWAERVGVPIVPGQPDGDPAAVVFDAVNAAVARGNTTVIADTAGRLHTKGYLMDELGKIVKVTGRARDGAPDEVLLVLDGTAGQNAIQQARQFTATAAVTGLVVTKLDGTAKGGAVFAIAQELKLPVKLLGVGEKADDLVPMDPTAFVNALLPTSA